MNQLRPQKCDSTFFSLFKRSQKVKISQNLLKITSKPWKGTSTHEYIATAGLYSSVVERWSRKPEVLSSILSEGSIFSCRFTTKGSFPPKNSTKSTQSIMVLPGLFVQMFITVLPQLIFIAVQICVDLDHAQLCSSYSLGENFV